jgi:DNA-binding NtrC family response regulator
VTTAFTVLIVEDEPLVALDLAYAVEELDGIVIGPVATVAEAMALLHAKPITAAIIDANLADRDVTPLALQLVEIAIPFVVHTGTGLPALLKAAHPDLPVIMKPTQSTKVVRKLCDLAGIPGAS